MAETDMRTSSELLTEMEELLAMISAAKEMMARGVILNVDMSRDQNLVLLIVAMELASLDQVFPLESHALHRSDSGSLSFIM